MSHDLRKKKNRSRKRRASGATRGLVRELFIGKRNGGGE